MKKTYIVLAIVAAGALYWLYRVHMTRGVAAAQSAQAVATSTAPSAFVTERNNLENQATTAFANSLSNMGF